MTGHLGVRHTGIDQANDPSFYVAARYGQLQGGSGHLGPQAAGPTMRVAGQHVDRLQGSVGRDTGCPVAPKAASVRLRLTLDLSRVSTVRVAAGMRPEPGPRRRVPASSPGCARDPGPLKELSPLARELHPLHMRVLALVHAGLARSYRVSRPRRGLMNCPRYSRVSASVA